MPDERVLNIPELDRLLRKAILGSPTQDDIKEIVGLVNDNVLDMLEKMGDLLIDIRGVNFTRSGGLGDRGLEVRTDALIRAYKAAKGIS